MGSSSPRRHELLRRYGLEFDFYSPDIDEVQFAGEAVRSFGLRMVYEKAKKGCHQHGDAIILAGDTIVYHDHQVLGKPIDREDAQRILFRLSGQWHQVYSAYILYDAQSGKYIDACLCTSVKFKALSSEWIEWYTGIEEPMDKAGAYSIQGLGTVMVEEIRGSYNTVVGFPIEDIFWHLLNEKWIEISNEK
ncbi:MAG: septum formation protein Maf [SAR324 cluster bacterium]|nr:septum formation protein Maf [SAR324 cluster bacterium]